MEFDLSQLGSLPFTNVVLFACLLVFVISAFAIFTYLGTQAVLDAWKESRTMHQFSKEALIAMGRKHWQEYLPEKYRALKKAGTLESELAAAAEMTLQEMQSKREAGLNQVEAWEMVREHHLILPEEATEGDEPTPNNPAYDVTVEMA
jgi:hypothetical protein